MYMENLFYKLLSVQNGMVRYSRVIVLFLLISGLLGTIASAQSNTPVSAGITGALCQLYNTIRNVIFLLGLALVILGGAVYAGATIMPGSQKGGFQGYAMGMIVGGIIGVAIAVAAPFILNLVVSANANSVLTSTGTSGVSNLCSSSLLI